MRAAGLGSCCIGFALDLLNTDAIKNELHLPPHSRAEEHYAHEHLAGFLASVSLRRLKSA